MLSSLAPAATVLSKSARRLSEGFNILTRRQTSDGQANVESSTQPLEFDSEDEAWSGPANVEAAINGSEEVICSSQDRLDDGRYILSTREAKHLLNGCGQIDFGCCLQPKPRALGSEQPFGYYGAVSATNRPGMDNYRLCSIDSHSKRRRFCAFPSVGESTASWRLVSTVHSSAEHVLNVL